MIRINLLPVRHKKKDVQAYTALLQAAVILGITLLIVIIFSFYLIGKVSDLRTDEAAKAKRLQELQVVLKEVENYEKDNAAYKQKTQIIEQLKKNQHAPLRLLDEVSALLPKGVWLTSMVEKSGIVDISGFAFTNANLVEYVQNLKGSKYMQEVTLIESRQTSVENTFIYSFKLTFKLKV